MTRLALLTEIPAPYRIPLFNALAERVELSVGFLRERNPDRPYDLHADEMHFEWRVLPGFDVTLGARWLVVNRGVAPALRGADVVVLGGWNQPAFWQALALCRAHRVPAVLWVESTGSDHRTGRLDAVKRRLLGCAHAFVVPGSASRAYVESLGVPADRITVAPNAVDPGVFGSAARTRTDDAIRIVAVGRLAPEKGIDTLLEAARGLPAEVLVAGVGPEEPRLRTIAGPNVTFVGQIGRDELATLYADADVAVMPSRSDPWGMVLNEAALAGLPLVSTTAAGAAWELIEDGVNGFRIPSDDPGALRAALTQLVEDDAFRRSAGARSREISARFTPEGWADAVVSVVR